ncbi:Signal transduction response regulator, receiver region domain protein [Candidatus Magnetomorum sp. HK-1]|nr:Signal transduction response regulator, receiver region domain protein [Candidatus Magnetomorum sp. HK-1]
MKLKHPKKILVVDDEDILLEALSDYLKTKDYHVISAENAFDGLTLFMSEKPDIALVDIRMPDMDGLELTAKILKHEQDAAIIVISGTGCVNDAIKALKLGAWDFILKPIQDMAILDHAITKALERVDLKKEKLAFEKLLKEQVRLRTDELEKINTRLIQEIDEHKKTEAILKANENHYHSIFENAPVGIFQTTPEGQFIDANPALAHMMGYETPKDLIDTVKASTIANVLYEHPDIRSDILEKALEKKDWIRVEIKFRHKKGDFIPINLIIKESWNTSSETKYLMGFVEERCN